MHLQCLGDYPPAFIWLLAYSVAGAGIGYALARWRPWTLWATIPIIVAGHLVLADGFVCLTAGDQVLRLISILVPPLGALLKKRHMPDSSDRSQSVP